MILSACGTGVDAPSWGRALASAESVIYAGNYWSMCCTTGLSRLKTKKIVVQVEMMQLEVDAMQAEAGNARAAAEAGQAAVTEVERLAQDNALLAARLAQMDTDLQVLICASPQSYVNLYIETSITKILHINNGILWVFFSF